MKSKILFGLSAINFHLLSFKKYQFKSFFCKNVDIKPGTSWLIAERNHVALYSRKFTISRNIFQYHTYIQCTPTKQQNQNKKILRRQQSTKS